MHGSMRRREETEPVGYSRAATAPPADPTTPIGGAVLEMEACWPSGVALRGEASNHRMLRWLKTVVVSDPEKARLIASGGDQEDVPESVRPGVSRVGVRC
jgi:hypothetical protein